MTAEHLEVLVEEPSMELFLRGLLPRILDETVSFEVYPHLSKQQLLRQLPARLQAYARWLPESWRIVVIVDCDDDECTALKQRLEQLAAVAGLRTRSVSAGPTWQVVNRIAIEELEAWYFGDWEAVREVYPRVSATIPRQEHYRDPDAVPGGTWEAFERVLQRAGYFRSGLRKAEIARAIGKQIDPARNRSRSFQQFRDAVLEAVA